MLSGLNNYIAISYENQNKILILENFYNFKYPEENSDLGWLRYGMFIVVFGIVGGY